MNAINNINRLPLTKGECLATAQREKGEGVGSQLDTELQHLVNISGLKEEFIAEQNNITPQYFSMLKTSARSGIRKRLAIKIWLIQYVKHSLTFKLAA